MSLARSTPRVTAPTSRQHEVHQCEFCDGHYPLRYGLDRRYCRRRCKYRSLARSLLDDVRYDHQYCGSCYRKLKDVTPPALSKASAEAGRSPPDCAIGRQIYREHTVRDVRNLRAGETGAHDHPIVDNHSRQTCSCPTNHHAAVRDLSGKAELTAAELVTHTDRLADAVEELAARGVHDTAFDRDRLFQFVRDAKDRLAGQGKDRAIIRDGLSVAIREAGG